MNVIAALCLGRLGPRTVPLHPQSLAARAGDRCPGFKTCPSVASFPLPYNGTYPASYPYVAGRKFNSSFVWAVGTASYQIEGAYNEGGRGATIWDSFVGANTVGMPGSTCSKAPCPVSSIMVNGGGQGSAPGATGNVANNHYHLYKRDVETLSSFGLNSYRFSIAWSRIFPTGHHEEGPNAEGVAFYHKLIDALIAKGVEPIVTMYHWDLPQGLIDAAPGRPTQAPCDNATKQGWFECTLDANGLPVPTGLEAQTVKQFAAFATFLLNEYGQKVKKWVTFNEAWTFTYLGSGYGKAPSVQPYMNMTLWPYVSGHNVILAHLKAVQVFKGMRAQGDLPADSLIGITNNMDWREPMSHKPEDIAASQAALEGQLGWFADPIYGVNGVHDYPDSMKRLLPYLPTFSTSEKGMLKAARPDFFGQNHYGTGFVGHDAATGASVTTESNGKVGIVQGQSTWLFGAGWGFRKLLVWVANRYGRDTPIYCTEAGWSVSAKDSLEAKYDSGRLMYYYSYLNEAWKAINEDGVPLVAFAAWSLMDNFEWEKGYSERFGTLYADLQFGDDPNSPTPESPMYDASTGQLSGTCGIKCTLSSKPAPSLGMNQTRHAKNSALWLQWLWRSGTLPDPAPFLAGSMGNDVCYGDAGTTYSVNNQVVACAPTSEIPGMPPAA
jgi:beta-glucosidase/6-phospho-beta-glucosidase/beta-galactosidase